MVFTANEQSLLHQIFSVAKWYPVIHILFPLALGSIVVPHNMQTFINLKFRESV
jgi:hypothetical protein